YATYLFDFLGRPLDATWWTAHQARAQSGWKASAITAPDTLLGHATFADSHFDIPRPIVAAPLDDTAPPYLATLATATLEDLRAGWSLPDGTPLLYRLARQAALASYLAAARRASTPPPREPELIGLTPDDTAAWTWLDPQLRAKLDAARGG